MALTIVDLIEEVKKAEEESGKAKTNEDFYKIIVKLVTLILKLLQSIRSNQVKLLRAQGIPVGRKEYPSKEKEEKSK